VDGEQPEPSRREFLKEAGAAIAATSLGFALSQNIPLLKAIAEGIRSVPGLGYKGMSVPLAEEIGSQTLLTAPADGPGNWVGAPAVEYDSAAERLLVHVRWRSPSERGYRVSLHQVNPDTFEFDRVTSVRKDDIGARSIEGGEIRREDGEYRWLISYQSATRGDWRIQQRRDSTIGGLSAAGADLDLSSQYFHTKDPAYVNDDLYVISHSGDWLDSQLARVTFESGLATLTDVEVAGAGNARVTGGGIVGDEVFADVWPDFPGTDIANVLWTTDERGYTGSLEREELTIDSTRHFVSRCHSSLKYLDAEAVGDTVYMMWQEETCDGSNDLVGTVIGMDRYRELFGL